MKDMMGVNEITSSIRNVLAKRISSPLYGTFFISYIIINWNFFYTAFFISEEKIWEAAGELKNVYLIKEFFNYSDWHFWLMHISPFLITYLIIWKLPKWISIPAIKKDEEYKTEAKKIQIAERKKLEIDLQDLEKENVKRLDIEKVKVEKEKNIEKIDPSTMWDKDFEEMKKMSNYGDFRYIIDSIYEHYGRIREQISHNEIFEIPITTLAYADANSLIKIDTEKQRIELTDKGKFFSKRFLNDLGKDTGSRDDGEIKLEDIPF